ncbi:MAG: hypothetical protein A2275_06475 [Bacteroidetes bacterium RIFOXYA12_FULL_35_11]|nr:MAG: hypothetical protein A2X01_11800 [Bacteroidetes bacterium GWF2_35_48]OFY78000.1 MAG: hypothetical protein A2275_06475 [Bacteroidetes bacterium RIFOXYA12_FULL_35_11]OFY94243.1 MAG: hypothetical protein A2491_13130 [Bacteroidetes bacterium RIFOXYC12_FULL_35_7]
MRKIAANYIITLTGKPLKNGILVLNDDNVITEIIDTGGQLRDAEKIEFYNGILVPGFVNCHCHLELSFMKERIPAGAGIDGFIDGMVHLRKEDENVILHEIHKYDRIMASNGIVAVGDISNNSSSFELKKKSSLFYHTFCEVFHPDEKHADDEFIKGLALYQKAKKEYNLSASIVPHAPHTVSDKLFSLIKKHAAQTGDILCIHNQESATENEYFLSGTGKLYNKLKEIRKDSFAWEKKNVSSLKYVYEKLPPVNNILFVHNTFSSQNDIETASSYFKNLFWCLCPNSNLYIENALPDVHLLRKNKQKIVVGTDSLASNTRLNILEELKTISANFDNISLEEMISWACLNGAEALNIEDIYGSFYSGKKPGVVLLEKVNIQNFKLTQESKVKVIV